MIARLIAWVVLSVLLVAGYQTWNSWKNPWASVSASPVLSMLPPASDGCSKDCKK